MQAGIIHGFTGLVKGIVEEMKLESGYTSAKIIATGGMSELITAGAPELIDVVDRALSLKGLQMLYEMNKNSVQEKKK
jgi:type III pantothenate kinase